MQHKEEVKSLIHDLTTLYESCMYPQYLPSSVNDSFKSWSQKILTTTEESMALPNEDQVLDLALLIINNHFVFRSITFKLNLMVYLVT